MKLIFFGTSAFAVPILEAIAARHEIVAVVTQPDRPAGRGHKLVATPVARAARASGLTVVTPERLDGFGASLRTFGAEAFVVASYGKIVPRAVLDVVPIAFNVHPSLLPLYRGATPLQSAIRDGQRETGVSIIAMDAGMDTGDVLVQERAEIGSQETYGELHDRLAQRGAALLLQALHRHADGTEARRPQRDIAREMGLDDAAIAATRTRPLRKEDLTIDWSRAPHAIVDHVRSLAPNPAARTALDGEALKVLAARVAASNEAGGTVTADGGYVHAGVAVLRVVPPNRAAMTAAAWRRSLARR